MGHLQCHTEVTNPSGMIQQLVICMLLVSIDFLLIWIKKD